MTFTHGDPLDTRKCGRPVTARFDSDNPEAVIGWTCLLHGQLTAGPAAEVMGTAVQYPRLPGLNPAADEVREIFSELRDGLRTVVEELRQEAFPVMTVEESNGNMQRGLLEILASQTDAVIVSEQATAQARIERLRRAEVPGPCQMRSSVTNSPCMLEEGHAEWRPTRFHKFARPDQTPVTGTAESEPDVFRQRRPE